MEKTIYNLELHEIFQVKDQDYKYKECQADGTTYTLGKTLMNKRVIMSK